MGLFGAQPKQEPVPTTTFEEEPFDEIPSLPKANNNTIIAQGITFTGVIRGEGNVQIEGRLEGEIDLRGGVTIAPSGTVQGPIAADAVRVAGNVEGSITARDHLCLERTGAIHGDVATASLIVENGRLDGSSTMLASAEPPRHETDISVQDLQFGPDFELEERDT
ncbi:polymer-forming cytoskeletal protein [Colidextribacter sp. OB.20]|uniref:bactofilin family protein n=1 Tax=Colidextribacter sp. OB.20 TaxID=2304568 RepID=UPI0013695F03|nr:polymer-forming cytoskeletal protein [Colidextribacter sp. OB.20]NBI10441.1 polymer-forming cytoskeletal protein [Colidextribacter sp. OB.20]